MSYDPTQNPRHLDSVREEDVAEFANREMELSQYIDVCNRQLSMFQSKGWLSLMPELAEQVDAAKAWMFYAEDVSIQKVERVRGQVRAFEYLLRLPETVAKRREAAHDMLKQHREMA